MLSMDRPDTHCGDMSCSSQCLVLDGTGDCPEAANAERYRVLASKAARFSQESDLI